jgi:hypothetical protein
MQHTQNVYRISEQARGPLGSLKQLPIAETAASIEASSPYSKQQQTFSADDTIQGISHKDSTF